MKNKTNKVFKTIIFLLIFCIIYLTVRRIFWLAPNPISEFYKEPENSFDIIYTGSSNTYVHFNPVLAYKMYGFKVGLLSSNWQPFVFTEYLIKEARKYHNPSLYIIDLNLVAMDDNFYGGGYIRVTTDAMKFSKNRIDAINAELDLRGITKKQYKDFYFSFLIYHNMWKRLDGIKESLFANKNLYKGYALTNETIQVKPQTKWSWTTEKKKMRESNIKILESLIKYIKENNLNCLFTIPKRYIDEETQMNINYVTEILEENGLKYINFNLLEDFKVDYEKDFYNQEHLNTYGSTKYTLYFAKYLKEHYDLPDHRENEQDDSWNEEYERFKINFKKMLGEDFDTILKEDIETNSVL